MIRTEIDSLPSALDAATEREMRNAVYKNYPDCAKIIISQKIISIKHCEEILVLSDGHIAGRGAHSKLLKTCREYLELYQSQQ